MISVKNTIAAPCAVISCRICGRSDTARSPSRNRADHPWSSECSARGSGAAASTTAITAKLTASTVSAAEAPAAAVTMPPSTGPTMLEAENSPLMIAFPSRSAPARESVFAIAPRLTPRAVIASVPSTSASARTATNTKSVASHASPANARASSPYMTPSTARVGARSTRAVSSGARNAGTNRAATNSAVVPSAESV